MRPLYFPFTYLAPASAAALRICFNGVMAVQTVPGRLPADMEALRASGWLEVRSPRGIDAARLVAAIEDCRRWAESNRGSRGLDTGRLQPVGGRVPFYDDNAPSRIRDAIRGQGRGGAEGGVHADLLRDLLFLAMAERFDIETRAVGEGFAWLAGMEAGLFAQLKGDDEAVFRPLSGPRLGGGGLSEGYMLGERLAAWRRALSVGGG